MKVLHFFAKDYVAFGCALYLLTLVLIALFAPLIAPYSPTAVGVDRLFKPPSWEHLFGTDNFGRDILSRVIYGLRVTLRLSFATTALCGVFGIVLAGVSYFSAIADRMVTRGMDILMALPVIVLALVLMAILGRGEKNMIIALVVIYAPRVGRMVRSQMLTTRNAVFVEAARALGANNFRIYLFHIVPGCLSVCLVQLAFVFVYAVLVSAALSFLGLGTAPPIATLGNIISEGRTYITFAPWISLIPGIAIASIILALTIIGDKVRDAADPRFHVHG